MQVVIVGGGMIAHDQILPSFYQLQRLGLVKQIAVCARHQSTLEALAASELIQGPSRGRLSALPRILIAKRSRGCIHVIWLWWRFPINCISMR